MDDFFGDEVDWIVSGVRGILRKMVIWFLSLGKGEKMVNIFIISGFLGCGKIIMVYVVVNELNFEIFEINFSMR